MTKSTLPAPLNPEFDYDAETPAMPEARSSLGSGIVDIEVFESGKVGQIIRNARFSLMNVEVGWKDEIDSWRDFEKMVVDLSMEKSAIIDFINTYNKVRKALEEANQLSISDDFILSEIKANFVEEVSSYMNIDDKLNSTYGSVDRFVNSLENIHIEATEFVHKNGKGGLDTYMKNLFERGNKIHEKIEYILKTYKEEWIVEP